MRFKTPREGHTDFLDKIKGPISIANEELDDLIIQRTDGTPTYNFVVVVDDAEMRINLIIRGDDHINNTPRQIPIYKALGYQVPEFAHVPMILGADKKRLSKRHGATSVMAYKEMGYLPEAMINYLVRLGWSFGDQEIFSLDELIDKFSLGNVGKSAGVFNPEKRLWLNEHYIKTSDSGRLGRLITPMLIEQGVEVSIGPALDAVVKTLQDRAKTLVDLANAAVFYYKAPEHYDENAVSKFLTNDKKAVLELMILHISQLDSLTNQNVEQLFGNIIEETGLKMGKIGPAVRVALVGTSQSPNLYDVIAVLGKEETLQRLKRAVDRLFD